MLVSLTVGKVDAGVTVLLTQDKRLIEFPSILLPPNISSGSIVDITVSGNAASEKRTAEAFGALQTRIYETFGVRTPSAPVLRCRNATQTSVVLEWAPVDLATADLLSLALYRNGQKAGNIPRPLQMHSTKISGLAVDTAYTFHLVLRTSAGTFTSERLSVRTHKMTDLSGITITTGILPASTRERLAAAVDRIGAKMVSEPGQVRIDTTHFVTTEGRGPAWEKAAELNIPVVRPEWVEACERSGRILGVTKFYLDAVRGPNETEPVAAPPPAEEKREEKKEEEEKEKKESKELPKSPKDEEEDEENEEEEEDEEDEDDKEDKDDNDKTVPGDDQKVFLGDNAKVALRPGASDEDKVKAEDKQQLQAKEDKEDKEDQDKDDKLSPEPKTDKPTSPNDGNSFQDVDL